MLEEKYPMTAKRQSFFALGFREPMQREKIERFKWNFLTNQHVGEICQPRQFS